MPPTGTPAREKCMASASVPVDRAEAARLIDERQLGGLFGRILPQLIALGDFASVYLALGLGIDPSPTRSVLEMKERIESSRRNREG